MIKAVLFDFDGVVVRSEPIHMETFLAILSPYGVDVPAERWYREFAGTGSRHIFEVLVREKGLSLDIDELVSRRKSMYEKRVRAGDLQETKGFRRFAAIARERGIRCAIVSGSHRTNVQAALETLGLSGYFDLIVSGDDLPMRKPDPGPFLHAAKALHAEPGECLVIEDSAAGCMAARQAGMRLVWMRPPVETERQDADLVVSDFDDPAISAMLL